MHYHIHRALVPPDLSADFDTAPWADAETLEITHWHERGSDHKPRVRAKVLYDDDALYLHFHVEDRYVLARRQGYQDHVCRDSCVEFFVQPRPDTTRPGYFNFEVNCGGAILLAYAVPAQASSQPVSDDWLDRITIAHTLPARIDKEIDQPTTWRVAYSIPIALFEHYTGGLGDRRPAPDVTWRANFYKCADESSHPHWGMWRNVEGKLSFHKPEYFGDIHFT